MASKQLILSGRVLDEMISLSLDELCRACRVRSDWVLELVDEGILEPQRREHGTWRFAGTSLRRVQIVWRLQHDLGINLAGAALALDLIDEIEGLRARLGRFE
ncbi:MAG: chaperone modulator CbpM [Chromatiales bacterium]|jgi:chaperone modulatory protein CbpM